MFIGGWKRGASQAAEKPYHAVILSPFAVILSAAKNLALPLRVDYAKDLARSIFKARRDSSPPLLLGMTALSSRCSAGLFFRSAARSRWTAKSRLMIGADPKAVPRNVRFASMPAAVGTP